MFEIVEIDRRQFIRLAGGALIALGGLDLFGCGGAGGGSTASGQVQIASGSVQFPSGYTAKGTPLSISNGLGASPLNSKLGFSKSVAGGFPSLAYVEDSSHNLVLLGFVDPESKTNAISAFSSAVVLIYFMIGAHSLPAANRRDILNLIAQDQSTIALGSVIAARISASPLALSQTDPQITSALKSAFSALQAESGSAVRKSPAQASPAAQTTTLLSINPSGVISGFEINQDAATVGFVGTNHYRRECMIYVYEIANDSGPLPAAIPIGKPIKVPATQQFTVFGTLSAFLKGFAGGGGTPFSPVVTPAIPLALENGNKKTSYSIVVLGASGYTLTQTYPAFFKLPIYALEAPDWGITVRGLTLKTFVVNLFMGLVLELLGVNAATATAIDGGRRTKSWTFPTQLGKLPSKKA